MQIAKRTFALGVICQRELLTLKPFNIVLLHICTREAIREKLTYWVLVLCGLRELLTQ